MKISSKGRYALRMMVDIARHNTGEWISIKDISERQEISVKYLEQMNQFDQIRIAAQQPRASRGIYACQIAR